MATLLQEGVTYVYAFKYLFFKQENGSSLAMLSDTVVDLFSKRTICAVKVSRKTQKKIKNLIRSRHALWELAPDVLPALAKVAVLKGWHVGMN